MKFAQYINEKVLLPPPDSYIDARLGKAKKYFNKNQTLEQVCDVLSDIFDNEIQFFPHGGALNSLDVDAENVGIQKAKSQSRCVIVDLNKNALVSLNNPGMYKKFIETLKRYFAHEMVHVIQNKKIPQENRAREMKAYMKMLSKDEPKEYHAHPSEMMAFALTSIYEFKDAGLSKEQIINTLKTLDKNTKKSLFFTEYKKFFAESDKKIWNKFLRYCSEYAAALEEKE